jgi:glutathione S-transferase
MLTLHHQPLDPASRFTRLCLGEYGVAAELQEERPTERREAFLALNPAGTTPVLVEGGLAVCGAGPIVEYLDETRGFDLGSRRLFPADPAGRAEMRRLLEWFNVKFHDEVSHLLLHEKLTKRFVKGPGGSPDMTAIRAARANIRYHLRYIGFLMARRSFLAGDWLTAADLAAAAHLSTVDYFGDVPWDEDEAARTWYTRMKSRPSFRPLLGETVAGIAPATHYADLDF